MTTATSTQPAGRATDEVRRSTAWAGVAYALAWVVGLVIAPVSADVTTSGHALRAALAGHEIAAGAQYVITEAVTSVLLVAVLAVRHRGGGSGRVTAVAAVLAAAVGLVECALGLALTTSTSASEVGRLADLVNRLDGAKMLLLAVAAAALARDAVGATRARRRAMAALAVLTALALTVSGIGYLALDQGLADAAWVSLPLLIVVVVVAGVARSRPARIQ